LLFNVFFEKKIADVQYEDIGNTLTPREFTRISSLPMSA